MTNQVYTTEKSHSGRCLGYGGLFTRTHYSENGASRSKIGALFRGSSPETTLGELQLMNLLWIWYSQHSMFFFPCCFSNQMKRLVLGKKGLKTAAQPKGGRVGRLILLSFRLEQAVCQKCFQPCWQCNSFLWRLVHEICTSRLTFSFSSKSGMCESVFPVLLCTCHMASFTQMGSNCCVAPGSGKVVLKFLPMNFEGPLKDDDDDARCHLCNDTIEHNWLFTYQSPWNLWKSLSVREMLELQSPEWLGHDSVGILLPFVCGNECEHKYCSTVGLNVLCLHNSKGINSRNTKQHA